MAGQSPHSQWTRSIFVAGAVAALMAACAVESPSAESDQSVLATQSATEDASTPGGASVPASASPGPPCDSLASAATGMPTAVSDVGALVGTDLDPSTQLAALADFAPALGGLVPTCIPTAEASLWKFLGTVEELRQRFSSRAGTEASSTKVALLEVRAAGAHLFQNLGLDDTGWAQVPPAAQLKCRDLDAATASMDWDVRHMSNLLGSDNVDDADFYSVAITALTSAFGDLVAVCQPKARGAMDDFAAAVDALVTAYLPGDDPTVVEANKSAFASLRATGIALYSELGLDTTGWTVIPTTER